MGDDQEDLAEIHTETMALNNDRPDQRSPRIIIRKRLQERLRKVTDPDFYDDMGYMEI